LRGSTTAVTSPAPKTGCVIDWPERYVRVLSYGSPDFAAVRAAVATPALNGLRVPHFGQLTRVMRPAFVTDATTWPRSSPHTAQNFSTRSPL
jgi:hypothetical protein